MLSPTCTVLVQYKTTLDSAGNLLGRTHKCKRCLFRLILAVPCTGVWSTLQEGFSLPAEQGWALRQLLFVILHLTASGICPEQMVDTWPLSICWCVALGQKGAPWLLLQGTSLAAFLGSEGNAPLCGAGRLKPSCNIGSLATAHGYKKVGIKRQYISKEIS